MSGLVNVELERQARRLVHTSVQDALSGAPHFGVQSIRRAIQLEQQALQPRIALIRGLQAEIRKRERQQASAPKDAA